MGIRRQYRRLRYFFSWKYPNLFRFVQTLAFPVQVLVLCLVLFALVSFYQNNFSFEATMRAHAPVAASSPEQPTTANPDTLVATTKEVQETDSPALIEDALTSIDVDIANPTETETAIIAALIEPPLTPPLPAGTALIKRSDTALQNESPTTTNSPTAPVELPAPLAESATQEVFDTEWLNKQRDNRFVIQLATSSQYSELVKYARGLPVNGPLVIYPFKKNSDNGLVYGLSAGLHNSITEATAALETLPKDSARYGYWIRAVAEIKSQVSALTNTP